MQESASPEEFVSWSLSGARKKGAIQFFAFSALAFLIGFFGILYGSIGLLFNPVVKVGSVSDFKAHYYAEFTAPMLYDTGYDYTENGAVKGTYAIAEFSDGFAIVLLSGEDARRLGEENAPVTGVMVKAEPFETDMMTRYVRSWADEDPSIDFDAYRGAFSSFKVVTGRTPLTTVSLAIASFAIAAVLAALAARSLAFSFRYRKSPDYQKLSKFGEPEFVESQINMDFSRGDYIQIAKSSILTDSYLCASATKFSVLPTESIAWVYTQRVASHKYIIVSYYVTMLRFVTFGGAHCSIQVARKDDGEQILRQIMEKYPDKIYGFSKEARSAFKEQKQGWKPA
jgi:hypothetical protein